LLKFGDLGSELGVFLVESFDGGPLGGGVILSHWEGNLLDLIKCMKDRIQNLKFLHFKCKGMRYLEREIEKGVYLCKEDSIRKREIK
jgi:hypothetical protein